MKKMLKLTRVLLKNTSLISLSKHKWGNRLLSLVLLGTGIMMMSMIYFLATSLYTQFATFDQGGMILSYGVVGLSVTVFFFGIFYVLAMFYYSKDIELLLYMPFKPYQIIGSKLIVVIIYEYVVTAIVFLPVMVAFGLGAGAGVVYYIIGVLITLLIPIIPLTMGGIFVMIIMRFTNIGKRKEAMTFVGSLLVLVVALGFNFAMQAFVGQIEDGEAIQLLVEGNNSLVGMIGRFFPGATFAINGLVHYNTTDGLMQLLLFVGVVVAFIIIFVLVAQKIYFKGVIGISEAGAKRKAMDDKAWKKHGSSSSLLSGLVIREFKMLLRSPTYFLNCMLAGILIPVIFVGMFVIAPESDPEIQMLMTTLTAEGNEAMKLAIFLAFGVVLGASNGITSTGISREGRSAYIMKYIPVPMATQLMGKIVTGLLTTVIGLVVTFGGAIYLGIELSLIGIGFVLAINGTIFVLLTGMIVDLFRPKLVWDNEQQAVKQNLNLMINLAIGFLLGFGLPFLVFKFGLSVMLVIIIGIPLLAFVNYVVYLVMKRRFIPLFLKMDL